MGGRLFVLVVKECEWRSVPLLGFKGLCFFHLMCICQFENGNNMLYLIIIAKYNFSCFFSNRLNPRSIPGLRIKKKQNSKQFHRYIGINQCCKKTDLSNTRYSCHRVMSWITVFVIFLNVVGIPLNAIVIVIVKRTTLWLKFNIILLQQVTLLTINTFSLCRNLTSNNIQNLSASLFSSLKSLLFL